jgi:class 3 adenylate cyclase
LEFYGTPLELAARYFRTVGPPLQPALLRRALDQGNRLDHLWLSLLYGKDASSVRKGVILDLNLHDNPQVAEYSVWAIYRDSVGGIQDLRIFPQEVPTAPPNIRRWYYRVLTKDPNNLRSNYDLIEYAIRHDDSPPAREGLALGLGRIYPGRALAKEILQWFYNEDDELVRIALIKHFLNFKNRDPEYAAVLDLEARRVEESSLATLLKKPPGGRAARSIFIARHIPQEERRSRMPASPRIQRTAEENIYVLGIDTVDFSSRPDSHQVQIFEDLLNALANNDVSRRVNSDHLVCLLTGDGLFAAFRDVENRHAPLRLALALRELFSNLRTYTLRFGVNSGPASWIELSDGSRQLIGRAINWTARIMDAAEGNQVLMSAEYYEVNVKSAIDHFPGYAFESIAGLRTKKHEDIRAYEAKPIGG